jgi:methyl-accepting chemotaxis protein
MRINQPVTQNEYKLTDSHLIVSKTDLKGRITYVNRDFLEVSGFLEQELIGEPHNIVRHPDMPVEAFEDLWNTLKEGRPWTGYVKNRCKNGDYYWVLANATPIWENGQITGYMSVRRKPDAAVVAQVDEVYRKFREKKQGNLKIRYGQAVSGGESFFSKLNLAGRMGMILGGLGLIVVAVMLFAVYEMSRINNSNDVLYEKRFQPTATVGRISKLMGDNRTQIALSGLGVHHDPKIQSADHSSYMKQVRANIAEITSLWDDYLKMADASPEHRQLIEDYATKRMRFVKEGLLPAAEAIDKGDNGVAWQLFQDKVNPLFIEAIAKADELAKYHKDRAASEMGVVDAAYAQAVWTMIGASIVLLIIGFLASRRLISDVREPIRLAIDTFRNITQGVYSNVINISRDDELGKLNQALQSMQTRMGFEVAETKRQAEEMARIKEGLYSSTAAITISNAAGLLIHATPAAETLLKAVSGRSLAELTGNKLTETVLTDPKVQSDMQDAVQRGHDIDVVLGSHHLRLSARPIKDEAGNTLGRVTTWLDRTAEVRVEQEVASIIAGAGRGDFNARLGTEGKEGFFKQLSEGLNQLSGVVSAGLNDVATVLQRVAQGDLTRTIETDYQGLFGQLKDDTNTTVERLREVVGRIKEATEAINTAAQEIAAGNQDLSSRTEEQASSLEETASSMEELNATVKQNAESARQANELATSSNEIAVRGGQMVKQVVATMSGIQASSKKIADIVGVIDSIAFQTNILALNAAVEAARAGEQGRGFAVVATEVRNLAQRSATAAKEIKALIAESVDKVEGGAQLVHEAGTTMDEVVTSFQQVARLVVDISNASREQSSGIEQVTQAVSQMDEVTQQNAALVEEAAAAAESLEEQAQGLVQAVGMFKLAAGTTNLPGPALRDVTPKRLAGNKPGTAAKLASPGKKIAPPHLADDQDEWEEF